MAARQLKPKPQYSVDIVDELNSIFSVTKWSAEDHEEEAVYKVVSDEPQHIYTCDCYAGLMGKYCRHKQIVDLYKAEPQKLGSVATYNFDRKQWM
jgi:hypothetical protein